MTSRDPALLRFVHNLRRRGVFRTAGLYIIGVWLVMQAADVFFPAWSIPDTAIRVLLAAAVFGFPIVLFFGWTYDLTAKGIVRTPAANEESIDASLRLQRRDFLILGVLAVIVFFIMFDAVQEIAGIPPDAPSEKEFVDLAPLEKPANSIAVLPFVNISNEAENEAFCDGISEEILNRLGSVDNLHVIARTSSFAFKNSDYRIPRISALLGVRYLLQGSVRKYGDQLRISAQLVDENGTQKWSGSFDRTQESVFAIQTEIANVVATTIAPQIALRPAPAYEPDVTAYQHFLTGRDLVRKRKIPTAREELGKAIELDPGFAEAHAELAVATLLGKLGKTEFEQAAKAIGAALMLQPGLPRALAAQGLFLQQQKQPDWVASEHLLKEALEGDPHMVDAMNWLSNAFAARKDITESIAMLERAIQIDPLHETIVSNLANEYFNEGDVDRAEQMLLRLLQLPEPGNRVFLSLRELYELTGQLVKMNAIEKQQALTGMHIYYGLALSYAMLDLWKPSAEWNQRMNRDFPEFFFHGYCLANVPMWQGDYTEAVRVFERELASRDAEIESLGPYFTYYYGVNLALAGDYAEAVETLKNMFTDVMDDRPIEDYYGRHSLAWSYIQLGEPEVAQPMLAAAEREFSEYFNLVPNPDSRRLYFFAQNAVLMGDHELALDRLQDAVDAGWRGYYIRHHDPRWTALADNPRYQTLMAGVKADVDRQRAVVEQRDAEEDFAALLDKVQATRR